MTKTDKVEGKEGGLYPNMSNKTSVDHASDQILTEDALAPGKIPQGISTWREADCGCFYHEDDRFWNCDSQYLGHPRRYFADQHLSLHPYESDVLYWKDRRSKIPLRWCWCLQQHHADYINEHLWDAEEKLREFRTQRDNAIEYAKNGRQVGARELTLTYSPDWYDEDTLAQQAFKTAVERLTKYYRDELTEFRAVGEYTKAGRSHVHILYHLSNGGKFTDKNLKRAYPHWNPKKGRGGHHSLVKSKSDFSGYLEKDLEDAWCDITYPNADDPTRT